LDKKKYPPQKCPACGGNAYLYSVKVDCSYRYDYKFQCEDCKKKLVVKGPDPKEWLKK